MDHTNATALPPTILVIVGITGDLSKRKLLPALLQITTAGALPQKFRVIGITRRDISIKDVLHETFPDAPDKVQLLEPYMEMYKMDLSSESDYKSLRDYLSTIEQGWKQTTQILFYLSVPPKVSRPIVKNLGSVGLNHKMTKLLLEKPFGTNLASAQEMIDEVEEVFPETHVYRIDHYLAKEMAQNIIVFRESNALFRRVWSNDFIEHIEIIASETIGIENRAIFYEQTGALRDIVQSHLMQLLALTLMEIPDDDLAETLASARLKALREVSIASRASNAIVRAQYVGYRDEVSAPHSMTETFASLTLKSHDPRWKGVPITLVTGKALEKKTTEIRVYFRRDTVNEANRLTLRIQPHEGIEIDLWAKEPGYQKRTRPVSLQFAYASDEVLPEAYEHVLLDAIRSNKSLFASGDEVLATWRILEPIQKVWETTDKDLRFYEYGASVESIIRPK